MASSKTPRTSPTLTLLTWPKSTITKLFSRFSATTRPSMVVPNCEVISAGRTIIGDNSTGSSFIIASVLARLFIRLTSRTLSSNIISISLNLDSSVLLLSSSSEILRSRLILRELTLSNCLLKILFSRLIVSNDSSIFILSFFSPTSSSEIVSIIFLLYSTCFWKNSYCRESSCLSRLRLVISSSRESLCL